MTAELASLWIIILIWVSGLVVGGIALWERYVRGDRPWQLTLYLAAVNLVFMGYRLATDKLWGVLLSTVAVLWLSNVTYEWHSRDPVDKSREM